MIFDRPDQRPGAQLLLLLACIVVVVWGMKLAAPILLPSALALILTVLSLPAMLWLRRNGLPGWLSVGITILMNLAVFSLVVLLAAGSLARFQERLPEYVESLGVLQTAWIGWLETHTGFMLGDDVGTPLVSPGAVMNVARGALAYAAQFVSTTALVFVVMSFMLSEAMILTDKVRFLWGGGALANERLTKVVGEVHSYLAIKTGVSFAVGILVGIWCWFMELDLPILLGLTAFLLHFIPTVGGVIAAVPAILLSLVIYGTLAHAATVGIGYLVISMILGNILEPHLQGRQLGLSTLVVVLSLLFWGWAWGPVGALLSVPLTVIVRIWLENTEDLRWVAVLLDSSAPKAAPAPEGAHAPSPAVTT